MNKKLSKDDVRLIRELHDYREKLMAEARTLNDTKIAEKFEIHPNTVRNICKYANREAI